MDVTKGQPYCHIGHVTVGLSLCHPTPKIETGSAFCAPYFSFPQKRQRKTEGTVLLSHPITAAHTVIIASYIPWPIIRESVVQFRIFIRKKHSSAPISPVKAA